MTTRWTRVLTEGLAAGAIGYVTSALVFVLINLYSGQPLLHTPAVIGGILFYGLKDTPGIAVSAGPVIACNGLYLVGYIVLGTALSWLAAHADEGPHMLYAAALALVSVMLALAGYGVVLSTLMRDVVPWWSVLAAGVLSLAAMVYFVYRTHPAIRRELQLDAEA